MLLSNVALSNCLLQSVFELGVYGIVAVKLAQIGKSIRTGFGADWGVSESRAAERARAIYRDNQDY